MTFKNGHSSLQTPNHCSYAMESECWSMAHINGFRLNYYDHNLLWTIVIIIAKWKGALSLNFVSTYCSFLWNFMKQIKGFNAHSINVQYWMWTLPRGWCGKIFKIFKEFLLMWIKYTKKIPLHSHMLTDSPNNILEYLNFIFKR